MAIQLIVPKILRDELALRGIRSLTAGESEAIAARIFERITDLELELAGRDFDKPEEPRSERDDEGRHRFCLRSAPKNDGARARERCAILVGPGRPIFIVQRRSR